MNFLKWSFARRGFFLLTLGLILSSCGGGGSSSGGNGGGTGTTPTVPTAPTNVAATGGNAQVSLTWTASTGATTYNVKRGTTTGGPYTTVGSPSAANFTDSTVTNGTTYFYVVTAVNSAGESANSAEKSATPTASSGSTVPSAPTGVNATAGNAQIVLGWTASTGATSYNVKRSTTTGGPYTTVSSPTTTSFTDTGLTNGTAYFYVVTAVNSAGESSNSTQVTATPTAGTSASVHVNVDVLNNRHVIVPFVYGGAFPKNAAAITDSGITTVRWGGNATTRYNWTTGTYNSANDFFYSDYLINGFNSGTNSDSVQWVQNVIAAGGDPLMTMVMIGWVSKGDPANNTANGQLYSFSVIKYGAQCQINPDTGGGDAGNGVKADCSTNVTANDPTDANVQIKDDPVSGDPAGTVYRHPWATALATAFGTTVPHFYDMDNEVDIWSGTHRDVHPTPVSYEEWRDTYLLEASNLKTWDPNAVRLGPVSCCWFFYWNGANNADKAAHGNVDLLPWWLNEVAWRDQINGTRSIELFDIHAYPETPDGLSSQTTAQKQAASIRAFRDWWDPTYVSEAQEVNQQFATSIEPLRTITFRIPRMHALVNTIYPKAQLAITEWATGFADTSNPTHFDFSTAIADAMGYGILGQQNVALASRWTAQDPTAPGYQTLKLYRNYDGSHSTFGDISVGTTNDGNTSTFAAYSAVNSTNGNLTIMVVNGDPTNSASVGFNLSGYTAASFKSFTLANSNPTTISPSASQAWSSTQTFAPYSVTLLVISGTPTTPGTEWELNPTEIMAPANGSAVLSPQVLSGSGTINLTNAMFDAFAGAPACTSGSININTATLPGSITLNAGSTPAFCHFTVTGSDGTNTQTKGGWLIVGNPAATLTNSTAAGNPTAGSQITLSVTLNPGTSISSPICTSNPCAQSLVTGASILFTADAGTLSNGLVGNATTQIVKTNAAGVATVTLTVPSSSGTAVHVKAEGPYGLGHPTVTFTETTQ